MSSRRRKLIVVSLIVIVLTAIWVITANTCPSAGFALTTRARNLHRLKNRSTFPREADFDSRVTLESLLQTGDDRHRWSTDRAARIQGYVIDVAYARAEATNCFSPFRRDVHIVIAKEKGVPKSEQVVLEVTPNFSDWAAGQGMDWSAEKLHAQLVNHWCEFEGWLYFDVGHAEESENIKPYDPTNWRATAWEVHPLTKITVIR